MWDLDSHLVPNNMFNCYILVYGLSIINLDIKFLNLFYLNIFWFLNFNEE